MAAYAAATASVASYEKIRDAASGDIGEKPAKTTVQVYRDVLERLFILDPVPAWLPTASRFAHLASPPKHHLTDPALAARLLQANASALLRGRSVGPGPLREGTLLGALFESLVTQSVRTYAQAAEAQVSHLRTHRGDHEIDLIIEHGGGVLAIEVKLAQVPEERDLRHLRWLESEIGNRLLELRRHHHGPRGLPATGRNRRRPSRASRPVGLMSRADLRPSPGYWGSIISYWPSASTACTKSPS